jgi:predicted kinase
MYAHKHPEPTDPRVGPALVYLIVGLPGAGKTTQAKELEISAPALRLTPDEWQIALFGDQNPPDKRDLVEGKLIQLGMRAAELGINVVFDFGFWGKDERSALRWIAGTVVPAATSSTCRSTTRNSAGGSPIGSRRRPVKRSA